MQAQRCLTVRISEESRLGSIGPPPSSLYLVDLISALDLIYAKHSLYSNTISLGFESQYSSLSLVSVTLVLVIVI